MFYNIVHFIVMHQFADGGRAASAAGCPAEWKDYKSIFDTTYPDRYRPVPVSIFRSLNVNCRALKPPASNISKLFLRILIAQRRMS